MATKALGFPACDTLMRGLADKAPEGLPPAKRLQQKDIGFHRAFENQCGRGNQQCSIRSYSNLYGSFLVNFELQKRNICSCTLFQNLCRISQNAPFFLDVPACLHWSISAHRVYSELVLTCPLNSRADLWSEAYSISPHPATSPQAVTVM